ncbi:hypothetical protein AMTRI_Chr01g135330 [Amborella trichopoda]
MATSSLFSSSYLRNEQFPGYNHLTGIKIINPQFDARHRIVYDVNSECINTSKIMSSEKWPLRWHRTLKTKALTLPVSPLKHIERCRTSNEDLSTSITYMSDLEQQLEELFSTVKKMIREGNRDAALKLVEANYGALKEQLDAGQKGVEQAAILDVLALSYTHICDFKSASCLLEELKEILRTIENHEPYVDSILTHMGSMYTTLEMFEEASIAYERGISIQETMIGKHSPLLVTSLLGIAKAYYSLGKAAKAIETYCRVISILEGSKGVESVDLVNPLLALGNIFIKEGKAVDAEVSFKRILSIYTKSYGEDDGRVGMAMCSLAHAACAKGNVDEAIKFYQEGLRSIKDSGYMSLDDTVFEKMRLDLAELLHVAGRDQEGRELIEECLVITEKYKGPNHPSSATHFVNLAISYSRSKNFGEAERLLRKSLEILSDNTNPDDPSTAVPMLHLAVTLYKLKRDEEAENLALEVVRIREKAFGRQSAPVGEALDCLVSIQTRLGKDEELLPLLWRVLEIQEEEMGPESEEVVTTLKKLVFFLNKLGRKTDIIPLKQRLSKLRTKYRDCIPT